MSDALGSPGTGLTTAPAVGAPAPGAVRAAALLLALGKEAAAQVLKSLPEDKLAEVARAARALRSGDKDAMDVAVNHFIGAMEGFDTDPNTRPRAFEHLLVSALGPSAAARAMVDPLRAADVVAVQPLVDADDGDVALLLERESPQIVALILSVLNPDKAAGILRKLPSGVQGPVVRALASLESVQPDYVRDVVAGLAQQIKDLVSGPRRRPIGGEKCAVEMLRKFQPDDRKGLLEELENTAPELAATLKSKLFAFEDVQRLGRRDIQALLQACDVRTLALALKGSVPAVSAAIYMNMSQRAGAALKEEAEMMGRVRLAQVEAAQAEIVKAIMDLAEQGLININLDEPMI